MANDSKPAKPWEPAQQNFAQIEPLTGHATYPTRPKIPRNLQINQGSLNVKVTWNSPDDIRGLASYRIYKDTESNLIAEVPIGQKQHVIPVSSDTPLAVYVSAVNKLGKESPKVQVIGKSNTDKVVATGTTGAVAGVEPPSPPEWYFEPGGGFQFPIR